MRYRVPGFTALRALVVAGLLMEMSLLNAGSASAATASASGNWLDFTLYCGSGICVPFGANHKTNVSVSYYRINPTQSIVYSQSFGGSVFPKSSFCGNYDWVKLSTWYQTASGNVTIGGWQVWPSWCSTTSVCRSFFSNNDYLLNCQTCKGKFRSGTWFTNRCFPNLVSHTTTVSF